MKTKLLLLSLALLLLVSFSGKANHFNGGYISYTVDPQNPLKYKFTFTQFANAYSPAHDTYVEIGMGDMNKVTVNRSKIIEYENINYLAIFEWEYTYQQPGDYIVYWSSLFYRSEWASNYTASETDYFTQFVHTKVQARLTNQNKHSVKTIVPAVYEAFAGEPFKMNLIAYDADGDSLSYQLVPSQYLQANGIPRDLPGYHVPEGLSINQAGEIYWENPTRESPYNLTEYALSVKVTEYKNRQPVGYTIVELILHVLERGQKRDEWRIAMHPRRVSLVNQNRLTYDGNGFVRAKADQPLKLEFYVEKAPNTSNSALSARQFSDVDTLGLATPTLAVRDSADGLAVTVRLNTTPNLKPSYLYTIGLRGATLISDHTATGGGKRYDYAWDFVSFYYGELLPTGTEDEIEKNARLVYPNPVRQEFVVEAKGSATLYLYTVEGKQVYQVRLDSGRNQLTRPTNPFPS